MLDESCSTFTFCQNDFILIFSQPWYLLFRFVSYYKPPSKQGGYLSDTWRDTFMFWVSLYFLWTGKNIPKQVSRTAFFLFKRTERDKLLYETTPPITSKLSLMSQLNRNVCARPLRNLRGIVYYLGRYANVWIGVGILYFCKFQTEARKPQEQTRRALWKIQDELT